MKKLIIISTFIFMYAGLHAQNAYTQQMQTAVKKLDNANAVKDYQQLADYFLQLATIQQKQWLPYYYAAFCNAKIGWFKQNTDPENIEGFANKADEEITKAESLIDTSTQKKELSEIYCVKMMLNQARVFINPETYGPK
jgi:DNA polymerase/3'-5' exonuclease PolX